MLTLTVVNRMLATLGEAPLNALTDPHTFRASCLAKLDSKDSALQTKGWWFNRELLSLSPNLLDSKIYLPGDVINVMIPGRLDIVQRGRVLYDTVNGTTLFTEAVDAQVIRRVPFEDLPELVAEYIAADAVLEFQSDFDADSNKRQLLAKTYTDAKLEFNAEATRQSRYNSLDTNIRLQKLKSRINYARKA